MGPRFDFGGDRHAGSENFLFSHANLDLKFGSFLVIAGTAARQAGFRGVGDFRHCTVKFAVFIGVHLEARVLSGSDEDDVDFANIHPRLHLVKIRNGHDFRAGHGCGADDSLAQLRIQLADGAVQRRNDGSLGEGFIRAGELRLGHFRLVFGADQLRFCDVVSGFELDENGIGNQFSLEQLLIAGEFGFGLCEVSFGGRDRRARGLIGSVSLIAIGNVEVRFDFHYQIALLDRLPFLDREVDDFAADFGADFDLEHGLNFAVRDDQFGQCPSRDFFSLDVDDWLAFLKDCARG